MWFWWIMSLVILLGSIIFSLYIYYGGYKPAPLKNKNSFIRDNPLFKKPLPFTQQQHINSLKSKLQSVENNSLSYFQELKKLQQRLQALEKGKGESFAAPNLKTAYADENWEELYYEVNDKKNSIENELDLTSQKLEEAESLIVELKRRETSWKEKRSDMEGELTQSQSLQNKIDDLGQQLKGAAERELSLKQNLQTQQELYKDYESLQQQYTYAQSEAGELKSRIKEINNRDILSQKKLGRLTELESNLEISEYEKMDIRKALEEIIIENEALAAKLQDLQEKLAVEKFA